MAKKGYWSRDRDARRAARAEGLKDEEFEVVKGPKGFTYRVKKGYIPVPEAKLHGIEKPPVTTECCTTPEAEKVAAEADKRVPPKDLDSDVDQQQMTHTELGGCCPDHPQVEIYKGVVDQDAQLLQPLEAAATGIEQIEVHEVQELPPTIQQEIRSEGLDPDKEEMQEKPVFSEKEQADIKAGAEASRQAEEYRNTHNGRGEKLPPGTFNADSLPKRVPVPRIHRSTVESPSKLVWEIAEEMTNANPKVARKEIIEECVKRGIAFYTARTQYQVWLAIKRNSATNAAKANEGKHA